MKRVVSSDYLPLVALLGGLGILTGCGSGSDLDNQLRSVIQQSGLNGKPVQAFAVPDIHDPLPQLGRALFFSTDLSGNGDVACATCHHPQLGGGDDLALPIGIDAKDPQLLGPGRQLDLERTLGHSPSHTGGVNVPRNSPTTFASAYYRKALFWDGRVRFGEDDKGESYGIVTPDSLFSITDPQARDDLLFAQSRFPVTSPEEMLGFSNSFGHNEDIRKHIENNLRAAGEEASNPWLPLFRSAFGMPQGSAEALINFVNVSEAIAAYQRSQDFINTPWADYVAGDTQALTQEQKSGALLFFQGSGEGVACASCHSGDFFTDERYYNLGVPQVGPGKDKLDNDFGRKRVTRIPEDKYRFRTPTLLNVSETGPYMHSGVFNDLMEVLKHHMDPGRSVSDFDFRLTGLAGFAGFDALADYPHSQRNSQQAQAAALKSGDLPKMAYSESELEQIVSFLQALTDPCVQDPDCLEPWLPSGDEPDAWNILKVRLAGEFPRQERLFSEAAEAFGIRHRFAPHRVVLPEAAEVTDPVVSRTIVSNIHLNMTGGVAVGDINNDHLPDIFLPGGEEGEDRLYLNSGNGSFTDITESSGIDMQGVMTNGATFADVTGDGLVDLFVGRAVIRINDRVREPDQVAGRFYLWKNLGEGRFEDISDSSGLSFKRNIFSSAFADYDRDGDLDMALGHWHRTLKNQHQEVHLWENQGDGKFLPAGEKMGLSGAWSAGVDWSFTPNFIDLNNDGWLDLIYTNDFEQTQYYLNQNGERFRNMTDAGVITDENGMGVALGDYDNDGDIDWFVSAVYDPDPKVTSLKASNWGTTGNRLYRNNGQGEFEDVTDTAGVREGGWGWAACMVDFNLDGHLDLFHVNGYLYDDHPSWLYYAEKFTNDRPRLYLNKGDGTFTEVAKDLGLTPGEGRGISCTDFDRDGDVDILIQQLAKPTKLYINHAREKQGKSFLGVRFSSAGANPNLAGARVRLTTRDDTVQYRVVSIGSNYLSQNAAEVHFGLGDYTGSVKLEITHPQSGEVHEIHGVDINQWLVVDL